MEIVSALLYLAMALPDISAASDAGAPQVIERFSEKKKTVNPSLIKSRRTAL